MRIGFASIGLVLLSAVALQATASDWPGWRGAGRDGRVEGFPIPEAWPEKLERGWRIEVGTGHSTPALVDGRLYVHARQGEEEVILAVDSATGKELWRDKLTVPYTMDPTATDHGKGPKSSPAVSDGRVFALGITGILSCLDAKTGKILWRHDFRDRFETPFPQYGAAMSPLILSDACIVHVGGAEKGAILALDAATGKERWSWDGDGPAYASPLVETVRGTLQLVTQTRLHAVGLSPTDGKLLWKLPFQTHFDQNSVTPILFENQVVLSGYHQGILAYRIDGEKPEPNWKSSKVSMYMSTGLRKENRLLGFSEKRRGQFFSFDLTTGEVLWTSDGRQGENAALVDTGPVVLALTTDSELVAFRTDSEEYEELARYTVADTPTWAHPVVSRNRIFVKDERSLTEWKLPQE